MARTVSINPPKTPCTTESRGFAKATIPNICKMPGPPAPFIPTPLPNIGKSSLSPKGYSKTVKIEGHTVAIRGATYESIGDIASKGTGGGLISCNTHGPTKFITPGSLDVKIEGKNVHLLGEPMLNNCGPSGSPPNTGATMQGHDTHDLGPGDYPINIDCDELPKAKGKDPDCLKKELCAMIDGFNKSRKKKKKINPSPSVRSNNEFPETPQSIQNNNDYKGGIARFRERFEAAPEDEKRKFFNTDCLYEQWKDGHDPKISPDHKHDAALNGAIAGSAAQRNLSFATSRLNTKLGACMGGYKPGEHKKCVANKNCGCGT